MPNLITLKRNKAQEQIDFNPQEITFNRQTSVLNSTTGSLEYSNTSYTETIRITKTNNLAIQLNNEIGLNFKKQGYVLLGNYESNMKCTKNITDTFIYNDEWYKITSVMTNIEKDNITSVQAIAEVMENG